MTDSPLSLAPSTLLLWAPPLPKVRYTRVGRAGPFELPKQVLEERSSEPRLEGDRALIRRWTFDVTAAERLTEDALIAYTAEGLLDIGTFGDDGELSAWDPPQLVMPAAPAAGASWAADHTRGEATTSRKGEVIGCPEHPDCLVAISESRRPDGILVLRRHFFKGQGYRGYEALVRMPGQPDMHIWTEDFAVLG